MRTRLDYLSVFCLSALSISFVYLCVCLSFALLSISLGCLVRPSVCGVSAGLLCLVRLTWFVTRLIVYVSVTLGSGLNVKFAGYVLRSARVGELALVLLGQYGS